MPAPRGSATPGDRPTRWRIGAVVALLVGAAVMLGVATLDAIAGTRVPVLSGLAAAPVDSSERTIPARPPPPATPGTCLNWSRPDAADAVIVDCAIEHLFEQAGAVRLADIPPGVPMPDDQRFRQLVNERCTPLVVNYLGGKYDPNGKFRAGALKPSEQSWNDGNRSLRCGLQRFSRSGALYPITGKVAGQDQADIRPPGTCLGIDGRFIGDPIDCSLPHAVESVGAIDLSSEFTEGFPSVEKQDEFLQPACGKLAAEYAGGTEVISEKNLAVLWDNLTQESWAAGTRKVACNLAAQLPDKSGYAPITGSVKGSGPVVVGERPAPPAPQTVPPGAPADVESSEPTPSEQAPEPTETVPDETPRPPPADDVPAPDAEPAPNPVEEPALPLLPRPDGDDRLLPDPGADDDGGR